MVGWKRRVALGGALGVGLASAVLLADEAYRAEVRAWREARETRLKADGGWLTVAGLFWLKEGANRFGSDPGNDIVLPAASAPPRAGVFHFREGTTVVQVEPGVDVLCGGEPVRSRELRPDTAGEPDVLSLGALTMHVIRRGDRYGIRLKDLNSLRRKEFAGLRWFEVREAYRVRARFVPYDAPRPVAVPNVLGQTEKMPSPGYAVFGLGGREVRLEGVLEAPDAQELFFIFRDRTSGQETYPSGRFLYSDLPRGGQVVLDFNKAYNPPCAFTPFATCPLPPPQNWLPVRVEAGELNYGHHE